MEMSTVKHVKVPHNKFQNSGCQWDKTFIWMSKQNKPPTVRREIKPSLQQLLTVRACARSFQTWHCITKWKQRQRKPLYSQHALYSNYLYKSKKWADLLEHFKIMLQMPHTKINNQVSVKTQDSTYNQALDPWTQLFRSAHCWSHPLLKASWTRPLPFCMTSQTLKWKWSCAARTGNRAFPECVWAALRMRSTWGTWTNWWLCASEISYDRCFGLICFFTSSHEAIASHVLSTWRTLCMF